MKKKIAIVLAVVMAMSVFAIPASAVYQLDGTGGVVWVDTEVLRVQLPTSKSFEFTLDPYGLLELEPGVPTPIDEFDGDSKIVFHDFVPVILNKSSREIRTGIEFVIDTNDPEIAAIATETWVDDDQQINMTVSASEEKITSTTVAEDNDFKLMTDGSLAETAKWLEFTFDRAKYEIELDEDAKMPYKSEDFDFRIIDEDDNAAGTALELDGALNPDADWSNAADIEIDLTIKFAFELAAGSTLGNVATVGSAESIYGLLGMRATDMTDAFERDDDVIIDTGEPAFSHEVVFGTPITVNGASRANYPSPGLKIKLTTTGGLNPPAISSVTMGAVTYTADTDWTYDPATGIFHLTRMTTGASGTLSINGTSGFVINFTNVVA